jgi:hypothetical protein
LGCFKSIFVYQNKDEDKLEAKKRWWCLVLLDSIAMTEGEVYEGHPDLELEQQNKQERKE